MLWTVETFTGAELCRIFCSAVECLTVRGKFDGKMKILQTVRILKLRGKKISVGISDCRFFFHRQWFFFKFSAKKKARGEFWTVSFFFHRQWVFLKFSGKKKARWEFWTPGFFHRQWFFFVECEKFHRKFDFLRRVTIWQISGEKSRKFYVPYFVGITVSLESVCVSCFFLNCFSSEMVLNSIRSRVG